MNIGKYTELLRININNCVFIGYGAGKDILEGDGIVIIGDNIKSLDKLQDNVLFIGEKIAIGETLFGEHINLKEVLKKLLTKEE